MSGNPGGTNTRLTADAVPQTQPNTSHKSKKQQAQIAAAAASKAKADAEAAEAADVITVTIPSLPEKEIVVGSVRHRLAEPLLLGKTPTGDNIWETIGRAVGSSSLNVSERIAIWDGVAVIGDMARFTSKYEALFADPSTPSGGCVLSWPIPPFESRSAVGHSSVSRPLVDHSVSRNMVPTDLSDYIANFKGATTDVSPFLGASMVAKQAFSDHAGKLYVSKPDYNLRGPAAIYGVWPE